MDKTRDELIEELDILHSGLMALEKLVVSKGLVSLDELNALIKEAQEECRKKRMEGKKPVVN